MSRFNGAVEVTTDPPNPLDYERRSLDTQTSKPRRRDRIGSAARLIGCTMVAVAGAVLLAAAVITGRQSGLAKTCEGWGTAFLIVGMLGFIVEYFASWWAE